MQPTNPTCPHCGAQLPDVKTYEGQGITIPDLSVSLSGLVDSIVDQYI